MFNFSRLKLNTVHVEEIGNQSAMFRFFQISSKLSHFALVILCFMLMLSLDPCRYTLSLLRRCRKSCCKDARVDSLKIGDQSPQDAQFHIQYERKKPSLGDFTIDEYMEKVIQYGYLMVSPKRTDLTQCNVSKYLRMYFSLLHGGGV